MGKEINNKIIESCSEFTLDGWEEKQGSISALCGMCNNKQTVNADGKIVSEGCLVHRFKCLQSAIAEILSKSKI